MTSFASRTRANGGWLAFRIRLLLALALVLAASAPAGARAATNNIFTVAGTSFGFSGDGGPATAAQFAGPAGVAASPDGGVLISDTGNDRVRRVSPAGTITTVAGTDGGLSGDGGPATEAQLDGPIGVAVTPDGGFLITDTFNHRIRRVSPAGTITTVAGTDEGFSGDGGPATVAQLANPFGMAVSPDGGFLIADTGNHKIRKVSALGLMSTVAGTGSGGDSGDGGAATSAMLKSAQRHRADRRRRLPDRRQRQPPDPQGRRGTITTLAGTGTGLSGDGGAPPAAQLIAPDQGCRREQRRHPDRRHRQPPDPPHRARRHDLDGRGHQPRAVGRRRPGDRRPAQQPGRGGGDRRRRLPDRRLGEPPRAVRRRRPAGTRIRTRRSAGPAGAARAGGRDRPPGTAGTRGPARKRGRRGSPSRSRPTV